MNSSHSLPRHLSDADFKSCVVDMGAAHRRFRKAVKATADALRLKDQEDQTSADTEPHSILDLLTRVLETSAFPTDETQDLARDCPALVTAWLNNGRSDVNALAEYNTIGDHPKLKAAVLEWATEAETTETHLSQTYEYVDFPPGMPGLTSSLTTDNPVYWAQRVIMKEEESIEIAKPISKLWSETVRRRIMSEDLTDLLRHLTHTKGYWKFPSYWKSKSGRKRRELIQQQTRHGTSSGETKGLSQEEKRYLLDTAYGLRKMCEGPIEHLQKALRDNKHDPNLVATALNLPSEMSPQIASRKKRIEQNIRDAGEYHDKAVKFSDASKFVEHQARADEASEAPQMQTSGMKADSIADGLTEEPI